MGEVLMHFIECLFKEKLPPKKPFLCLLKSKKDYYIYLKQYLFLKNEVSPLFSFP